MDKQRKSGCDARSGPFPSALQRKSLCHAHAQFNLTDMPPKERAEENGVDKQRNSDYALAGSL